MVALQSWKLLTHLVSYNLTKEWQVWKCKIHWPWMKESCNKDQACHYHLCDFKSPVISETQRYLCTENRSWEEKAKGWSSASKVKRPQNKSTLMASWFWRFSLQNCEKIDFVSATQSVVVCYDSSYKWIHLVINTKTVYVGTTLFFSRKMTTKMRKCDPEQWNKSFLIFNNSYTKLKKQRNSNMQRTFIVIDHCLK